ncbi:TPA: hypothetical protein ACH3X1_013564 [Trebouxia sp. C0004]
MLRQSVGSAPTRIVVISGEPDSAASSKVKPRGPKHANLETALIEWLKGFAAFMADNQQFTARDELMLQRWQDRVAKMLVTRVTRARANHRQQ